MALLSSERSIKEKYILVLLGPSGSGKTTYGQKQLEHWNARSRRQIMFLSTGLELRKKQIISTWREPDMIAVKKFCHKLINETVEEFKVSRTHQILILDCVKYLEDAEYVDVQARKHGLEVTRALLFNISSDELHQQWMSSGEDRELSCGSTHLYLRNWNTKSNDVVNYYKKSELLCTMKHLDQTKYLLDVLNYSSRDYNLLYFFLDLEYHDISEDYPVLPCKNNVHFVLTNSAKIKNIFAELFSILKVNQLRLTLPASFVHCYRDVSWVTNTSRYHVTVKADGVRCLLVKIQEGTYLITRKNEIYPCCIADDKLPDNTVLDGELLPSASISEIHPKINTLMKTSVFLVFDVLAFLGDVLWKWPFGMRQECLCKLPISKDIAAIMKEASANDECVANVQKLQSNPKENNRNELIVNCVVKKHRPSTPGEILKFIGSSSQIPYPCDGLIFTPNTTYVFGPDPLLFKWQIPDSIHCDILHKDLNSGKQKCVSLDFGWHPIDPKQTRQDNKPNSLMECLWHQLNDEDVIECQWNQSEKAWDPLFLRQDKSSPNSDETIYHAQKMCEQPYSVDHLIADLTEIGTYFEELEDTTNTSAPSVEEHNHHPSLCYSYDELYAKITELVQLGYVGKTVDPGSNLEILNYTTFVRNPLVSMCRGLVLDPDSKTVVTKPFVRFFEDVSEHHLDEEVEATIKYDGSLGIAFVWKGEVMVTTKRRMDSEQATWAKQWIVDHCNPTLFEAGYTYLFEIIYQNNTVVVNYLYEGLVLLAITTESGCELPYEELLYCAKTIGFITVTPRITAPYSEVLWYCGGVDLTTQESTAPINPPLVSGALPVNKRQEGWVVKFEDGTRQKILYRWRKRVAKLAYLVHPQIVWLLVKHDKIKELLKHTLPTHFRVEIYSMIRALGRKFMETVADDEESANLSPVYNSRNVNRRRLPILDCICPATSPELDGYEPSDTFKQNWCKGWKTLPINELRFIQEVLQKNHQLPPFLQFPVEVIVLLLEFLDGRSLALMTRVCMQLRRIVESSQVLRKKIAAAKEEHPLLKKIALSEDRIYRSCYSSRNYSSRYSYDYWGGCESD